ncbi:hypothetical protein C488_07272 [Natrinema pellirubrum DSM 15624]|uniref:Uncharacterized protein n=1 Tax=Natrinema pellirubrum (strain DSM 15624 / CIP 106293 / JCM 10476 / NCIMB 786 / 157) TaxID=797303 RepID=L0JJL7_NATP1|nr:hypothetical protein [Natrinema pellirubrum]AGB30541.1 hypothetical protein Natpe_0616 [Natrinema pellirubrum DSM 15624]ELY77311.1 hypothetical protein C488_07272 [Natrinema pellirubrum DSM 15624]
MVRRDITGFDTVARIVDRLSTIDRYDCLLGLIPTALTVAALVGQVLDLPTEATLLGGVAIALLALLDGLFFRPPTGLQGT